MADKAGWDNSQKPDKFNPYICIGYARNGGIDVMDTLVKVNYKISCSFRHHSINAN